MARISVAQVTQNGEGFIALIVNNQIAARFSNWESARNAYRLLMRQAKSRATI